MSGKTRLGICEGSVGGREVGVVGRDDVDVVTRGDFGRLKGDDRCAPKDNGLGFFGEVDVKGCYLDQSGGSPSHTSNIPSRL